jgi:hypothetical protein
MKIGTEDKKKMTILGVVGTLGIAGTFYIYSQLAVPDAPAPFATSAQATAASSTSSRVAMRPVESVAAGTKPATATTQLDPTLKMGPIEDGADVDDGVAGLYGEREEHFFSEFCAGGDSEADCASATATDSGSGESASSGAAATPAD